MDFHGIEMLLDLPAFQVIGQVIRPHEGQLDLERREASLVCPSCQGGCSRIKEGRDRCLRDLPMLDRPVTLRWHIRRLQCADCRHRPWEKSATFGDRVQWTARLDHPVRQECLHDCPCDALARRSGLSARTLLRWTCAKSHSARARTLGRAWGIDAYARRKGHRSHTIIVDVDTGRPITTCKDRGVEDVVAWFKSRPQEALDHVEVVVVDRSQSLYAAIKAVLGDQVQVMDRFPVVSQAVGALDSVLRSVQKQRDREEAKELKKLRRRWLKSAHQLDVDELMARADWRRRFPALREVIDWIQDLRKWFKRNYTKRDLEALLKLMKRARESAQEPLQGIAGTLSRWFEPIARSIQHRYTNGITKGCNNTIKLIQRRAFGLRNEYNRKKRHCSIVTEFF